MEEYIQANALLVFAVVMVAAAVLHWGQKVQKGEATADFIRYWFTETPGYSVGTLGALTGAWWMVYTTRGLDGMAAHMVVEAAFATGWWINSAVSPRASTVPSAAPPTQSGFIRPGMLLLLAALAAVFTLGGCQTLQELVGPGEAPKVDQTLSVPAQAAQQAVNEANLTITATANVIGNNAETGVMTKAEAQKALDEVADWRKKARAAQSLLDAGDIGNAKTQAELINQAVSALQKRVAAEARKPQ